MPAAAQLALIAFIPVGALLMIEIFARSRRSFQNYGRPAGCADDYAAGRGRDLYFCVFVACFYRVFGPVAILLNFVLAGQSGEASLSLAALTQQSFTLQWLLSG